MLSRESIEFHQPAEGLPARPAGWGPGSAHRIPYVCFSPLFETHKRPSALTPEALLAAPSRGTRRLRILLISTEAPPIVSGVARVVGHLTRSLRAAGHEVDHLSGADLGRVTLGEVRLSGLALKWRSLLRDLGKYDLVNLHGPAPTMSDAFLALHRWCRADRRPALVYTHHFDVHFEGAQSACACAHRAARCGRWRQSLSGSPAPC